LGVTVDRRRGDNDRQPNEHSPYDKIGFTGTFYFTTDDVEAMWTKVKDKAKVCYGIETFESGMR
jgi:hypothetical protein